MQLSLRHLAVVVAVADSGGINRAAARLGIAQPGLTAQLKRIEHDLGVPLFERRAEGVVPTDLGGQFISGARDLLARFETLVGTTRALAHDAGTAATIRIGATDSYRLSRVTAALAELLPAREQFVYVEEGPEQLLAGLRGRRLDLGLITEYAHLAPLRSPGLAEQDLGRESMLIGLSEFHPLAHREVLDLNELADEAWVIPAGHSDDLRLSLRLACEHTGFSPRFRHFGVDHATAVTLVRTGQAVGAFTPDDEPVEGVALVRITDGQLWRHTRLIWPATSPVAGVSRELAGHPALRQRRPSREALSERIPATRPASQ
jgi:DNA-binding transcriptional LysR family regulator